MGVDALRRPRARNWRGRRRAADCAVGSDAALGLHPCRPDRRDDAGVHGPVGQPADIVTLIKDGKTVRWLVVGGEIVNWTGQTVHVAGLHVTVLTPGGTIVVDREFNYDFRKHDYADVADAADIADLAR